MGQTSLLGAFALGRQSAKDSVAGSVSYLPTTSIGLNPNQNVQTLPPEIGGDYFLRDSYKSSVSGGGDVAMVPRANSFGHFLYALAGQDTVTPVPSQAGAYSHSFTPFTPAVGVSLPFYTLIKDVAKITNGSSATLAEQYLNAKLGSLKVDVPKASIMTASSSWIATTPSSLDGTTLGTQTFDSSSKFQTCIATVNLTQEGGASISTNVNKVERFSFTYSNNLSNDEYSVGNYYLEDITLLQRTVQVDMDFVVRDSKLYQAVYMNGGSLPGAWSPIVFRGALTVTLTSGTVYVPSTTQPYSLAFTFPGLDFMMLPIQLSGADLVRATLSTQVTLGPSGSDRFSMTLINGVASY